MPQKKAKTIVNKVTVNVYGGEARRVKERRAKLRRKLRQKKQLAKRDPAQQTDLPADVDLDDLVQHGNPCIATATNGLFVTHDPVVRFVRHRGVGDRISLHDFIYFDHQAWKTFGLQAGMQLALFTEKQLNPRYLIIQNVTGDFEAPAHLHRYGMFTLQSNCVTGDGSRNHGHVLKPDTVTPRGYIRNARTGRFPLTLFANLPLLVGTWGRLYQIKDKKGRTDLLLVHLDKLQWIGGSMARRATRPHAGLVASDLRVYDADKRATVAVAL